MHDIRGCFLRFAVVFDTVLLQKLLAFCHFEIKEIRDNLGFLEPLMSLIALLLKKSKAFLQLFRLVAFPAFSDFTDLFQRNAEIAKILNALHPLERFLVKQPAVVAVAAAGEQILICIVPNGVFGESGQLGEFFHSICHNKTSRHIGTDLGLAKQYPSHYHNLCPKQVKV